MAVIQAKPSRQHDQGFVLQSALPVAKGQVAGAPGHGLIGVFGVEQLDRMQPFGDAAPLGPGIHHHSAPHGAWDPYGPFQPAQPSAGRFSGQRRERFARLGFNPAARGIQAAALESSVAEGEAVEAPIGNEQVGARPNPVKGEAVVPTPAHQGPDVVLMGRFCEPLRGAAHLPGGELIQANALAQAGVMARGGHHGP